MLTMKSVVRLMFAGAIMLALVLSAGNDAVARPKYAGVITATYPELAEKHGKDGKLTCAVCHPSTEKSKKARNNYGVALSKHLTKSNETDEAKIKDAIQATEKDASAVEGKTFGDLIKAGELPGKDEKAN